MAVITNIMNNSWLFCGAALWLFWCAGYAPFMRKKWRTPKGMLIIANMILTTMLIVRVMGLV